MKKKIYTHDEAARLVEYFEEILIQRGLCVSNPEDDDERDPHDTTGLFGSAYDNLLNDVEKALIELLNKSGSDAEVISYVFSGDY